MVPWSQSEPQQQILYEITIYMHSIVNSLKEEASYTIWVYLTFAVIAFIFSLYQKTPYSKMVWIVQTITQASLISSMIVQSITLQKSDQPRLQFTAIILLLMLLFYMFISTYSMIRRRKLLLISDQINSSQTGIQWLWALQTTFEYDEDTKDDKLERIFINFESIIVSHHLKCFNDKCACKKAKLKKLLKKKNSLNSFEVCNKLKIALIKICLEKILCKTQSELTLAKQNDINGLLLVYQWQKINKNYLSCAYNLIKFHDCYQCTIYQCFQHYCLQRVIYDAITSKQKEENKLNNFQKMVYFETNFKTYQKVIENTIQGVTDFWVTIQKNQLDFPKSERLSSLVHKNYKRFSKIYQFLNRECGEIILVETVAWRFHQEILSFDYEAYQNLEKVKQIMNKQRFISKHNNDNDSFQQYNFKSSFIVIGACPNNMQKIMTVSKSLMKFSGFTEDYLLQNNITVMIPRIFAPVHEKIIKNYLKKKNVSLDKLILNQQWLQKYNGTLIPVIVSVIPRYDISDGLLRLIGMIKAVKKFEIFDVEIAQTNVFGIFTDVNFKVNNMSENCLDRLQMTLDIYQYDIYIHQMFPDLPEIPINENVYDTVMDLSICQGQQLLDNEGAHKNQRKSLKVKLLYKEKQFTSEIVMREFLFVVIGYNEDNRQMITGALESSYMMLQSTFQENDPVVQEFQKFQSQESDSKVMDIVSMSSASSASSSQTSQDNQIVNIKSQIEFNKLPVSLVKYRLKLILGFLVLMSTGFTLLGINVYSKQQFFHNLNALQVEKNLRNNFASSKLALIMLYSVQNMPSEFNKTDINLQTLSKGYGAFFQTQLKDIVEGLQNALITFSQSSTDWDPSFVAKMESDEFEISLLTSQGNQMKQTINFHKSVTLYLNYLDYLTNTKVEEFNATFDIFDLNTVEEFQKRIQTSPAQMKTLLQYMYYIFFNGSDVLLEKIYDIDSSFVDLILSHSDGIIQTILITALCCSGVVLIIITFYIPYFIGVVQIHRSILEFIYKTDRTIISGLIKQCRDFKDYVEKNQYMTDSSKKKKKTQIISSVLGPQQQSMIPAEEFKEPSTNGMLQFLSKISEHSESIHHVHDSKGYDIKKGKEKGFGKSTFNKNISKKKFEKEDSQEDSDEVAISKFEELGDTAKPPLAEIEHEYVVDLSFVIRQSQQRKVLTGLFFYLTASIIIAFYISSYFLSRSIFKSYEQGFYQYDIFYLRNTCVTDIHFLLLKSIMLNESVADDSHGGQAFNQHYSDCEENEQKYRNIKKDQEGIFSSIVETLFILDSQDACSFLIENGAAGNECLTDANGQVKIGLEQLMQSLMNSLSQQKINYLSRNSKERTPKYLSDLFYNHQIFTNVGIYYTYMQWMFKYVQNSAKEIIDQVMSDNFVYIIVVYILFEIIVLAAALVCIYKMIYSLKLKLQKIRLLLKLLPSVEIIKHKAELEKLNINQL